jgi:hypothetical protein
MYSRDRSCALTIGQPLIARTSLSKTVHQHETETTPQTAPYGTRSIRSSGLVGHVGIVPHFIDRRAAIRAEMMEAENRLSACRRRHVPSLSRRKYVTHKLYI